MKAPQEYLNKLPSQAIAAIAFALVIFLGVIDYYIGYEISFSLFYLMPIALASWFNKRMFAMIICVFSALVWILADIAAGYNYSHPLIPVWNTAIRLGFYLITAFSLSKIRKLMDAEQQSARMDYLTGIANSRAFYELANTEIDRSARFSHPFTIAYIDIDNFKQVNDTLGHSQGDVLLKSIAKTIQDNTRSIDIASRLGGDEFAVLFPETNETNARAALTKVQKSLAEIVKKNDWPVTFSIGVLTCHETCVLDELIKEADNLMYTVKKSGKNRIEYTIRK
jgi:diguanylate cyclase (GGDEF)-like protein